MFDDGSKYVPDGLVGASPVSPTGDDVHLHAVELDEEEQELWRQLRRKRDFETRVVEKRAQLQELRDRRRKVSSQHAEMSASVEHLTEQLAFSHEQVKEVEHDIAVLTESNRILQHAFAKQGEANAYGNQSGMDPSAVLAEERSRQESIQLEHDQIKHLRAHLEKMREEKDRMQHKQRTLFEKQRSAEQDRNRILGNLSDDRSAINEVRQERIRLWESRSKMEQEAARIVHEAHVATNGATPFLSSSRKVPGTTGGLRAPAMHDTLEAFAGSGGTQESMSQAGVGPARPHWAGFGEQASAAASGPAQSGGHLGSNPDRNRAPSFGEPRPESPELNTRSFGESAAGVGITEWSDKLRDYRSRAPDRAF